MYRLKIKDTHYQSFEFVFGTMEELSIFMDTVFHSCVNNDFECIVTKEVLDDDIRETHQNSDTD